jgi:hypothetical protein
MNDPFHSRCVFQKEPERILRRKKNEAPLQVKYKQMNENIATAASEKNLVLLVIKSGFLYQS